MYYTFYMQGFPKADDPAQIMDAVHFKLDPEKSNFQHQPYSNTRGYLHQQESEAGIMFPTGCTRTRTTITCSCWASRGGLEERHHTQHIHSTYDDKATVPTASRPGSLRTVRSSSMTRPTTCTPAWRQRCRSVRLRVHQLRGQEHRPQRYVRLQLHPERCVWSTTM